MSNSKIDIAFENNASRSKLSFFQMMAKTLLQLYPRRTLCTGSKIDLSGKVAFVAGVADSRGYGWAICKHLATAGAKILVGTWPMALKPFTRKLQRADGYGQDQLTPNGQKFNIEKVYALDLSYSTEDEIPASTLQDRHYSGIPPFDIRSVARRVQEEYGPIDVFVHSAAYSPCPSTPLLRVSRQDYLSTASISSYSLVACAQHFGPRMNPGGAILSMSYIAAQGVVPGAAGYGGGLSSAKAQLESDTRTLAWECGREWGIRVNAISAGPLKSRAAAAIGPAESDGGKAYIDHSIDYMRANAPLQRPLAADDVGAAALFLLSPLARAVTGVTLHVDNGLHAMAVAVDSRSLPARLAASESATSPSPADDPAAGATATVPPFPPQAQPGAAEPGSSSPTASGRAARPRDSDSPATAPRRRRDSSESTVGDSV